MRGAALKESWYLVSSLKRAAGPDYTTQAGNWGGRVTIYNILHAGDNWITVAGGGATLHSLDSLVSVWVGKCGARLVVSTP